MPVHSFFLFKDHVSLLCNIQLCTHASQLDGLPVAILPIYPGFGPVQGSAGFGQVTWIHHSLVTSTSEVIFKFNEKSSSIVHIFCIG